MLNLDNRKSVAVISDIHANATALKAVLKDIEAKGADTLVMLGDLLGYGPDIVETMDLLDDARTRFETHTIVGNHDQIYIELESGHSPYLSRLPDWLKESSHFTARQIEKPLSKQYEWIQEFQIGDVHFDHANPFEDLSEGVRNWSYLNDDAQIQKAGEVLVGLSAKAGVFGHNHRELCAALQGETLVRHEGSVSFSESADVFVLNPGTVGQPRSKEARATYMLINGEGASVERVVYDVDEHLARIDTMTISAETKTKLKGFFERARA